MPEPAIAVLQRRAIAGAIAVLLAGSSSYSAAAEFVAGSYSFSDEQGGFKLLSASGKGTIEDPVVIVEELYNVAPVTLVIRNHDLVEGKPFQAQLTLVKRVVNRS